MAATLITQPPAVAYDNDPILIKLGSNLINNTFSSIKITYTSLPESGNTLSIIFENVEYLFTYTQSAQNDPWEIETSGTVAEFCANAAARLQNNATINDLFVITFGLDWIQFQWKNRTAMQVAATTTEGTVTTVESQGPYMQPNLKAYVELWWLNHDASTEQIVSIGAHYNTIEGNTGLIDLRELFNLTYHLPTVPSINVFAQGVAYKAFRKYFLRFADKYGIPAVPEILAKTDNTMLLHGGSRAHSQVLLFNEPIFLCHNSEGQAAGKVSPFVHLDQPNWLYFYSRASGLDITMTTRVYYQPIGPTPIEPTVATTVLPQQTSAGINYVTSGFKQLLLAATLDPAGNPSHYTISLATSKGSVIKRYNLDYAIAADRPYIIFDNGLGGMETIYLSGEFSKKYNRKKNTFTYATTHDGRSDTETGEYNRSGNAIYTVSTGWQPEAYIDTLKQVLLGDAFLIQGNRFDKIEILSATIDTSAIHDFLFALALKFKMATPDRQYNRY